MLSCLLAVPIVSASTLFHDGFLGLTQPELRAKLGAPQKVRTRMAAQRVYNYHSLESWDNVLKDQMSGTMAEDVYVFTRDGVKVRYSFQYTEEYKANNDVPNLLVSLIDIEFLNADTSQAPEVPVAVPGVDTSILDPRGTWTDPAEYDRTAAKLVDLFVENFAQFADQVDEGVRQAAPKQAQPAQQQGQPTPA